MTVTPCQVQKVLRTYGRQLSRSPHLLRSNPQSEDQPSDSVSISARARRLRVLERVAADMIRNMGTQKDADHADQVEREALARLSGEYGENLGVVGGADGEIQIAVVNSETGEVERLLKPEESQALASKLHDITMELIEPNMVGSQERQ